MEFSRQQYSGGSPFSSSGDLPDPGIEPTSSAWQAGSLLSEPPGKPSEVQCEAHSPSTARGRRGSVQAGVMEGKTGEVIKGQAVESHLENKREKRKSPLKCLLALPSTSCAILAKILKSLTQFPHFKNGVTAVFVSKKPKLFRICFPFCTSL